MAWQDTYDGKRKLWYNAHGICRDCGQREVEPNTQLCFECAERKYKKAKEYYQKHRDEINERNKQTAKKRYAERKNKEKSCYTDFQETDFRVLAQGGQRNDEN